MARQQILAYDVYRSAPESEDNPVQHAVLRVFDRVVDASNPSLEAVQVFVGRMLLRPPQVKQYLTALDAEQLMPIHVYATLIRLILGYMPTLLDALLLFAFGHLMVHWFRTLWQMYHPTCRL